MIVSKVFLTPLHKISQLKMLKNCTVCNCNDGLFTMTFQLDNADGEEVLQDLAIDFKNGVPEVFISKPYSYENVESEL